MNAKEKTAHSGKERAAKGDEVTAESSHELGKCASRDHDRGCATIRRADQ
jgi:hypothetical protein